jgi:hypothetical protein
VSATVELSPLFSPSLSRVGFPLDRPCLERVHQLRWISEDRLAHHPKALAPGVEQPRTAIGPAAPVGTKDSDPRRHPMTANRAYATLSRHQHALTSSPTTRREPLTFSTPPGCSRTAQPSDTHLQVRLTANLLARHDANPQVSRKGNLQVCSCRFSEFAALSSVTNVSAVAPEFVART